MIRFIIVCIFVHQCSSRYFIIGPAKIILMKAGNCEGSNNLTFTADFNIHMYNRTMQLLDVNMNVPFDFDSSVGVKLKCSRLDRKQNAFTIEEHDACNTISRYSGELWFNIERQLGVPPGVCPFEKGYYSVKDLYLDLELLKVKMILEGKFYTRVMFLQEKKMLGCVEFEFELLPKNSKG